jgi:hypothetical protein
MQAGTGAIPQEKCPDAQVLSYRPEVIPVIAASASRNSGATQPTGMVRDLNGRAVGRVLGRRWHPLRKLRRET